MTFPFFKGKGTEKEIDLWREIPAPRFEAETLPEYYEADAELTDAVNVALLMNRPLLLTGDPGTGKTQLAFRLAWELGLGKPEVFETKSTSAARELFYTWDALGRFHDAECGEKGKTANDYITYNALGRAILLSLEKAEVEAVLPSQSDFVHDGPRRSVVLIDEIDKAPRDFPNDILNEIERNYFRVPELGNVRVPERDGDIRYAPVVVITSNSERHLPGPFLRRCVYHHIHFPDKDRMKEIVLNRLRHIPNRDGRKTPPDDRFITHAVELFFHLKDRISETRLSTGELIVWVRAMREMSDAENPLADDRDSAVRALGALVKSEEIDTIRETVREWKPSA